MTNPRKHLEVRKLKAWYGESHVLHDIDFDVWEGETVTLLGRNGAGKTTTLRAIMGILCRREGVIRLHGVDLLQMPFHRIAHTGIGYVPEERGIFASLTVAENLILPPKVADGGMSLEEIYRLFPILYDRRKNQGSKLSGGEQQMLAIARMLHTGAKILLLDEPAEGLAPVIIQHIGDLLKAFKSKNLTILLVEQNFHFARKVSDRFYLMEEGRMVDNFPESDLDAKMEKLNRVLGV